MTATQSLSPFVSRNGVTVREVGGNEAYDIFLITGITTEDESDETYRRELRGTCTKEDVLSMIVD